MKDSTKDQIEGKADEVKGGIRAIRAALNPPCPKPSAILEFKRIRNGFCREADPDNSLFRFPVNARENSNR